MAKNRGKKALYEVMSKGKAKQQYAQTLERIQPKKTEEVKPAAMKPKAARMPSKPAPGAGGGTVADWWKKPRIVQFNAGRFEFSVPYQVAIAVGLVLVLLLLGSYRLGQNSQLPAQLTAAEPGEMPVPSPSAALRVDSAEGTESAEDGTTSEQARASVEQPPAPAGDVQPEEPATPAENVTPAVEVGPASSPSTTLRVNSAEGTPDVQEPEPVKPKGRNVIVLAHSGRIVDLQPVVEHFAEHGIALKIVLLEGGQYELQTVERYERNPATPGTNAFEAKREIIRVGALYKGKAPAGLDTFAPNYFSDAYGKKVQDGE